MNHNMLNDLETGQHQGLALHKLLAATSIDPLTNLRKANQFIARRQVVMVGRGCKMAVQEYEAYIAKYPTKEKYFIPSLDEDVISYWCSYPTGIQSVNQCQRSSTEFNVSTQRETYNLFRDNFTDICTNNVIDNVILFEIFQIIHFFSFIRVRFHLK